MSEALDQSSVLRIGEVVGVEGQRIVIRVDSKKNLSDLFYNGDLLKNVTVTGFVEIKKGFLSLIGQVEGEVLKEIFQSASQQSPLSLLDKNYRELQVSLTGFIDAEGEFLGGLREFPLIGNEVFLMTREQIERVHSLSAKSKFSVTIAKSDSQGFPLALPVDGLFNSHIAIFGNTGSGKSNTLTSLYSAFKEGLQQRNPIQYRNNTRFLLIDFNGEYEGEECLGEKFVYRLSTRHPIDRIPIPRSALLREEIVFVLSDATEKTQKPFLSRALRSYWHCFGEAPQNPVGYFRAQLKNLLIRIFRFSEKQPAFLLLDYVTDILSESVDPEELALAREEIKWHGVRSVFFEQVGFGAENFRITDDEEQARQTRLHGLIDQFTFSEDHLVVFQSFMYLQLIRDLLNNRAQNEHIAPVINRLKSRRSDLAKVIEATDEEPFWQSNFVVVSLDKVNLTLKKTLPLLMAKWLYEEHKSQHAGRALTFIIDEAHNILSTESSREAETWKDYRLETFEEIIKEGRKFGVFVTISSQRPSDISPTITSQSHNYFIHRLVNQRDLAAIASAVSFIDRVSESMIPKLPVGTCIFSGVSTQMPLRLVFDPLPLNKQPTSHTRKFSDLVPSLGEAPNPDQ